MITLLILGFLIGMRHALEADHVAAVASLATRSQTIGETVRQGVAWGAGHTLTLFLFGSMVLMLDLTMPEIFVNYLEFGVGLMLIGLGADVLWRMARKRIHFHSHCHADGTVHFHAHAHIGKTHDFHHHDHHHGFPARALIVGLMHGMAGSAALILLTLNTIPSAWMGLVYMALFGIGSMAGMAALSAAIALPLRGSSRRLTWLHHGLQGVIGFATLSLGLHISWTHAISFS